MHQVLTHYQHILDGDKHPNFQISKLHPVSFSPSDTTDKLWQIHNTALLSLHPQDITPKQSLLDLKIELAKRIYSNCVFCEHRCKVNRHHHTGWCDIQEAQVASEFLHIGEEPPLIPSHTIFFSGCTMHCQYCQNFDISQTQVGKKISAKQLVDTILHRYQHGSKNVNWVGGDPTSNLLYILRVLRSLTIDIAQIWNSNMYCSQETMNLLNGVIDIYLTDFKYGNNTCANRLSKIENYCDIVQRNHTMAYKQGDLLIRHLVLPNHSHCCSQSIIDWIQHHTPHALVNIMCQYQPVYHASNYQEINQPLSNNEYYLVRTYAQHKNLYLI